MRSGYPFSSLLADLDDINTAIGEHEQDVKDLKKTRTDKRGDIVAAISSHAAALTPEDANTFINNLYWENEEIAGIVIRALHAHPHRRKIKLSRSLVLTCSCGCGCENTWPEEYGSWTAFNAIKNRNPGRCAKCVASQSAEAQRERLQALKQMPYPEYLKTSHWQNVRQQVLSHYKHRCAICNAAAPLQVHHRTYERRGEEIMTDVIALCVRCHERYHEELIRSRATA